MQGTRTVRPAVLLEYVGVVTNAYTWSGDLIRQGICHIALETF